MQKKVQKCAKKKSTENMCKKNETGKICANKKNCTDNVCENYVKKKNCTKTGKICPKTLLKLENHEQIRKRLKIYAKKCAKKCTKKNCAGTGKNMCKKCPNWKNCTGNWEIYATELL